MVSVEDLARFLLTLNPQDNPPLLALYNYLKNLHPLDENITAATLNQFFSRALVIPHWQKNRMELTESIELALSQFAEHTRSPWRLQGVKFPRESQIVAIENLEDLVQILDQDFRVHGNRDSRWKAIPFRDKGALSIEQHPDGRIDLSQFSRWIKFEDGRAVPLVTNTLHYDSHLELLPAVDQYVEISPYQFAKFRVEQQGIFGLTVRGFTFSKSDVVEAPNIASHPRLYYALKQLESFFINRASDPLYREVVNLLERSTTLLTEEGPAARELALKAFERGQNALEHIFPDDKVLFLLLRDLARTLESAGHQEEVCLPSPQGEFA